MASPEEAREEYGLTTVPMAQQSGQALDRIVTQSARIADMVRNIATASEQQSATSEEVAGSVGHINELSKDIANRIADANARIGEVRSMLAFGKDTVALPAFSGVTPILTLGAAIQPQSLWVLAVTLALLAGLRLFFAATIQGKAMTGRRGVLDGPEGFLHKRTLGSYVHLHFGSNPQAAAHFVAACAEDR